MLELESQLTPDDGVRIDISPASLGQQHARHKRRPRLSAEPDHRRALHPAIGPARRLRARARRILGRRARRPRLRRAIGTSSPTASDDQPLASIASAAPARRRPARVGREAALALNGATHDAAIQCWGVKRFYDSVRPISMVRYMGGLGQSSDPTGPSYDPSGLPLVPGLIEVVTPGSCAPGQRHADFADHVGEMVVSRGRASRRTRRRSTPASAGCAPSTGCRISGRRSSPRRLPASRRATARTAGGGRGADALHRQRVLPGRARRRTRSANAFLNSRSVRRSRCPAVGALLRRGRPGRYLAPVRRHPHRQRRLQRTDRRGRDRGGGVRQGVHVLFP